MPTGYTADVASGKITDFTEYALQCARNFGACIMLRDDQLSSEIPEFESSNHNAEKLVKAKTELSNFLAMNESQRRELYADEHTKRVEEANRGIAEKKEQRQRYELMLKKAKQFKSPSPDHENYAKFLVSQLEESIHWDCETSYYDDMKKPVTFGDWQSRKISELNRDIKYHSKAHQEEVERTGSRNRWVRELKEALGVVSK